MHNPHLPDNRLQLPYIFTLAFNDLLLAVLNVQLLQLPLLRLFQVLEDLSLLVVDVCL
jgi:hypothetical protein